MNIRSKLNYFLGLVFILIEVKAMAFYTTTITGPTCSRTAGRQSTNFLINASSVSFPVNGPWATALVTAAQRWNLGAANFQINLASTSTVSLGNGFSETWLTSDPTLLSGRPGGTFTYYNFGNCTMGESDMVFQIIPPGQSDWNLSENANHSPYTNPGDYRSFIGTGLHEFGHWIGLAHENRVYNIMGEDYSHLTRRNYVTFYGPGEDADNGAATFYGNASSRPDIGLTIMHRSGTNGDYSTHDFADILDSSGAPNLSSCPSPYQLNYGQPCWSVAKGATYKMQLTVENNGTTGFPTPIPVSLWLTTGIDLNMGYFLVNYNITHGRNIPYETVLTFTVPSGLASGSYLFLSAFYFPPSGIFDMQANNNAAYIPVYVQ